MGRMKRSGPFLVWLGLLALQGDPVAAQDRMPQQPKAKTQEQVQERVQEPAALPVLDRLFERLAAAKSGQEAKQIAERIERRWLRSGSDTADLLSKRAAMAFEAGDQALAVELLDRMISLKPDWAEAYYQRAVVLVMLDDHRRAVVDFGETLKREPRHYKAMLALAAILQKQDRKKAAFALYEHVLALYPFNETAQLLADHLRADVAGRDL
jgi:tetratricopeptide (TPR) repeat protein